MGQLQEHDQKQLDNVKHMTQILSQKLGGQVLAQAPIEAVTVRFLSNCQHTVTNITKIAEIARMGLRCRHVDRHGLTNQTSREGKGNEIDCQEFRPVRPHRCARDSRSSQGALVPYGTKGIDWSLVGK